MIKIGAEYLDATGLAYFWSKIKNYVQEHGGGGSVYNDLKWVDFQTTPSTYTTGSKTYTMTIPEGYVPVTNKPFEIFASGDARAYITDRTMGVSGSTLTIYYYLYNPNSATNLQIIGSVLFVKEMRGESQDVLCRLKLHHQKITIPDGSTTEQIELTYPVGSYYETSDTSFDPNVTWGGTWENVKREALRATGNKTVNAAQTYTLCSVTLQPNTRYIVLGNVDTDSGSNFQILASFTATASEAVEAMTAPARVTTASGQGCTAFLSIKTFGSTCTVDLQSYGYYTTSHTERGRMIAIPLDHYSAGNVWHRTA